MANQFQKAIAVFALSSFSIALADLPVFTINVSTLPYELSPSNYQNSPSNYNNSPSNYNNSANNYKNSPNNYQNSPNNYNNGSNGKNRLISNGKMVGYYADNGSGVINFFSSSGKRALYNPSKTNAVFTNDGRYAGVITEDSSGNLKLSLTPDGIKYLLLK